MEFNLTAPALINAGGALLFLLTGIAILAVGWGGRLAQRIGAFATTLGLAYIAENVVVYRGEPAGAITVLVAGAIAFGFLAWLILGLGRDIPSSGRWPVAAVIAIAVVSLVLLLTPVINIVAANPLSDPLDVAVPYVMGIFLPLGLLVLLAVAAIAGGTQDTHRSRLLLGLSTALFSVPLTIVNAVSGFNQLQSWQGHLITASGFAHGLFVVAVAWLVLHRRPAGNERVARAAFVAIVLVGLLGIAHHVWSIQDYGAYGILRTVGAVLLSIAILRHGLLGVPLPRVAVRRGALAGAALATLFIVAQVAQNFLSAEYGLLTGGIIAGTVLFAANPIQKAVERAAERKQGERPMLRATGTEAEATYRLTLRKFLRDGRITKQEELALAHLADGLGLTARRAMELRHEAGGRR